MDRDFGSKAGSGGVQSASLANVDRRERLRRLALDQVDLTKDPYFMKNHLGSYECKLCLTIHSNEGNYLAHTQGKRHKANLARRMAREEHLNKNKFQSDFSTASSSSSSSLGGMMDQSVGGGTTATAVPKRKTVRIGLPGYEVKKEKIAGFPRHNRFTFRVMYPDIEKGLQPRHRFMSSFEQRIQVPNSQYQYILFAADPYETIAFRVPNAPIDKVTEEFGGGVRSKWDPVSKVFELEVTFVGKPASFLPPPPVVPPKS